MEKKKAIVTGASEGIGRSFAQKLAQEGYQVMAVARNEARLKELVKEMGGRPHNYETADLTDWKGIEKISKLITANHYDLLINNAGFGTYGKFSEVALSKSQEMTRLNIDALVALSHAFLGKAQPGDALINVSSTLAFLPMPESAIYSATKAFVTSFTESLWFEQKKRDVYVMGLCPGVTKTLFHERAGGRGHELPKAITQTPEQVVDVALKALRSRSKPTVISGSPNKMMATMARLMSRKATVKMMGGMRPNEKAPA